MAIFWLCRDGKYNGGGGGGGGGGDDEVINAMVPNMITVMVISLNINCGDNFHENNNDENNNKNDDDDDDDDDENNTDDDYNNSYDEDSSWVHSSILQFKKSVRALNAMQCNSIQ